MYENKKDLTGDKKDKQGPHIQHHNISLPKGGGAISGMGEKFQANAVTGTSTFSVPIPVTKARGGFEPSLSLTYDSGSGNSIFGLGWSVDIPSVTRKTSKGLPKYRDGEESDTFILSDAEDLVPVLKENGERRVRTENDYQVFSYRPRIEGLFAKIEKWVHSDGTVHWQTITKDNITSIFGRTEQARINNPVDSHRVFQWMLEESFDAKGNKIAYEYKAEDKKNIDKSAFECHRLNGTSLFTNKHIKRIKYGLKVKTGTNDKDEYHFIILFDYGEHPNDADTDIPPIGEVAEVHWPARRDPFSAYRAGFEIRTYRLCRRIVLFHHIEGLAPDPIEGFGPDPFPVREITLNYDENEVATYLARIQQTGYKRRNDGVWKKRSFPPLELEYTKAAIDKKIRLIDPQSLENLPQGLSGGYQWIDLEGEGLSGIFSEQGDAWYYKRNEGNGHFAGSVLQTTKPSPSKQAGPPLLTDIDGDGNNELLIQEQGLSGTFTYKDGEWRDFRTFSLHPNCDFNSPNQRLTDLTGDGRPDMLITQDSAFKWYESLALKGYEEAQKVAMASDEKQGPRVAFAEPVQTIFLADMSGDGLTDIVRIRNGEVCYWPSLGYGHFGPKVTMGGAPFFDTQEKFDPRYIKFGDIDGSGTTDIFYLGTGKVRIWLNQAGNSLIKGPELPFPQIDSFSSVDVIDLLGKGTSCLVWSTKLSGKESQQLSYIDLMSHGKPHLLKLINNNMGKVIEITYASSTKYYLDDRIAGRPWITRLPFPVHVLDRVETCDLISGSKLTTTYRYHHGLFDGKEREFRGFGMVETLDTETFEEYAGEPRDYVEPVLTKTWFHTGAFLEHKKVSTQYSNEYYKGVDKDNPDVLPDTVIEGMDELCVEELHEAHRALKSKALRQEIYKYGGSVPYTVSESNFIVRRLQPRSKQKYAVFVAYPHETITWHYEQNPQDPRIVHEFILLVDDYGNVERSCTVAYPRRLKNIPTGQTSLYTISRQRQTTLHAISQVASFINKDPDKEPGGSNTETFYLVGVPSESKSLEIGGLIKPSEGSYLGFAEVSMAVENALSDVKRFDKRISPSVQESRLLSCQRFYYWDESQSDALSLGHITDKALLHHVESAVFTPELINQVFEGEITDQDMEDARYIKDSIEGSTYWFNPGLIQYYLDAPGFYLPFETKDPFGNTLTVTWDNYRLAIVKTVDTLGNTSTAWINYRTLSPWKLKDPNGNSAEAMTDPLGMVIATSVFGTEGGSDRGDLPLSSYTVQEIPNHTLHGGPDLRQIIDNPHIYLQGATTYFLYDLFAWMNRGEPVQALSLSRQTHVNDLGPDETSRVQIGITYSDGFGRQIQSKLKAEPGIAWIKQQDEQEERFKEEYAQDRWLVSGRTVYNNKQKPVKQYEPFYSASQEYEPEKFFATYGVTPIIHYDPLLRVIRTETPKGFFSKVEFTPWEVKAYDLNDTVKDSDYYDRLGILADEKAALAKAEAHYNTPQITWLDTLGREFIIIENILDDPSDPDTKRGLVTYTEFDITGNPLSITDPRQFTVNQNPLDVEDQFKTFRYTYDMTGTIMRTINIDAGDDRVFNNIMGNSVLGLDAKGHHIRAEYDELHRLVKKTVDGNGLTDNVVEVLEYGESVTEAKSLNLRGQLYRHFDQSGLMTIPVYDIKGLPRQSEKRLRSDYKTEANWPQTNRESLLEGEVFITQTKYDALGRVSLQRNQDGSTFRPEYHISGRLDKIYVTLKGDTTETHFVTGITYNPKGQREKITYGNDTETTYTYERETFRLTGLKTKRLSDNKGLQDISYVYDPVGNIVKITDNSHNKVFTNRQLVKPECGFIYDALYRLIEAQGREHVALSQTAYKDAGALKQSAWAHINDTQRLSNYTRQYNYDDAGNLCRLRHIANDSARSFTRELDVDDRSNRALLHEEGVVTDFNGSFDANGNLLKLDHLPGISWNYRDNIASATIIERSTAPNDVEYYVYDAGGQRVRKVKEIWKTADIIEVEDKLYIGNIELKRIRMVQGASTTETLKRSTLHIMDDKSRIALVHHWTKDDSLREIDSVNDLNTNKTRYQYGNHLGSTSLELDSSGKIISYEEYFPYGGTSFIIGNSQKEVRLKVYRYTGKERDDSTGLYYYGARYYAPWMGRWLNPDPAGPVDGWNLYVYVRGNPVKLFDSMGTQEGEGVDVELTSDWKTAEAEAKAQGAVEYTFDDVVVEGTVKQEEANRELAEKMLPVVVTWEGVENCAYYCSAGKLSIGIGFNIEAGRGDKNKEKPGTGPHARFMMRTLGLSKEKQVALEKEEMAKKKTRDIKFEKNNPGKKAPKKHKPKSCVHQLQPEQIRNLYIKSLIGDEKKVGFITTARKLVGEEAWGKIPDSARAVMTEVVYGYGGSGPKGFIEALQKQNWENAGKILSRQRGEKYKHYAQVLKSLSDPTAPGDVDISTMSRPGAVIVRQEKKWYESPLHQKNVRLNINRLERMGILSPSQAESLRQAVPH